MELTIFQKIIISYQVITNMFMEATLQEKITDIAVFFFFITGFNMAIIFPPLFNFVIEPRIEKKLGKKLVYPFMPYDTQAFGRFFYRHLFIVIFIVRKYWNLRGGLSRNPLFNAGYDISLASRFEIFVCFAAFINFLICAICFILMFIYLEPRQ